MKFLTLCFLVILCVSPASAENLDVSAGPASVGDVSQQSLASGPWGGLDVRIGERTGAESVHLDYDATTGHLFALIDWGPLFGWTMYLSTDDGRSWTDTYTWCCGLSEVDLAVVDGFVYVLYTADGEEEARMRRLSVVDGALDAVYDFQTAPTVAGGTIEEVSLTSNAMDGDDHLYAAILFSNNVVEFYGVATSAASTFLPVFPGVSNAARGLDLSVDHTGASVGKYLYLSFVDTSDNVQLYWLDQIDVWDVVQTQTAKSAADKTSVAAYGGVVLVSFEFTWPTGQGVQYDINYDEGMFWNEGVFAPSEGQDDFFDPQVSARSGIGIAQIYTQNTLDRNTIFFRERRGYGPGPWRDTLRINDFSFAEGEGDQFAFAWLGSGYAVAYFESDGTVWFDWAYTLIEDGFEGGNFDRWSNVVGD